MDCRTHADTAAHARCTGCAEPFCFNCSVEVRGQPYCADCKMMAVEGTNPVTLLMDDVHEVQFCGLSWDALKHALIGFMCCGIIMGPMAVLKGLAAKKEIEGSKSLYGVGVANAAIVIGTLQLLWWVLGAMGRGSR